MLKGKKILLGITGSIAAYKSAFLVRLLVKEGAEVKVIMTGAAKDFITPLTLSALSKNPVLSDFYHTADGSWNNHVALGQWADVFIIAPATANTIALMAHGQCDQLLLAVWLSARCPVFVAPAMDLDMWKHPATRANVSTIKKSGVRIIEPSVGELASGLWGEGRMAEPEQIQYDLDKFFGVNAPLSGIRALVSAGPTYEPIDPVRYVGNHSSGKMGFALATELSKRGAEVVLVTGPTSLTLSDTSIRRVDVVTAAEMHKACLAESSKARIIVMAAAVSDFRPAVQTSQKIKKKNTDLEIKLVPTQDILAEMGKRKKKNQVLVGFALETDREEENAQTKLKKKNLDYIILNSLREKGAGFGYDTNKVTILDRKGKKTVTALKLKSEIAKEIISIVTQNI